MLDVDLVHKESLLLTKPNTRFCLVFTLLMCRFNTLEVSRRSPRKVLFMPLVESPHFGTSDEGVSQKGELEKFPCNVEYEGFPYTKSIEEHTSYYPQGDIHTLYTSLNLK